MVIILETFGVPLNMKLHAIPVFEFYDNAARYGPQFAGLPYLFSKYVTLLWWEVSDQSQILVASAFASYARFESAPSASLEVLMSSLAK